MAEQEKKYSYYTKQYVQDLIKNYNFLQNQNLTYLQRLEDKNENSMLLDKVIIQVQRQNIEELQKEIYELKKIKDIEIKYQDLLQKYQQELDLHDAVVGISNLKLQEKETDLDNVKRSNTRLKRINLHRKTEAEELRTLTLTEKSEMMKQFIYEKEQLIQQFTTEKENIFCQFREIMLDLLTLQESEKRNKYDTIYQFSKNNRLAENNKYKRGRKYSI